MYNVVIFDDEPVQCEIMAEKLKKCDIVINNLCCVSSREDLEAMIEEGIPIDILIADIYLQGDNQNGIDVVRRALIWGKGIQVIYITGFVEYCEAVYETEHVYFLKKPVEVPKLKAALQRAIERLEAYRGAIYPIKSGSSIKNVAVLDIFYVESDKRKLRYVCKDTVYEAYGKLSEAEFLLQPGFVRCHKSFLVNLRYIRELKDTRLFLENGDILYVSRHYYSRTRECLLRYVSR